MIVLGKKIRSFRVIKGYSQEYMAHKIGVSQRTYSKLENGHVKIDVEKLQCIAEILEVDIINLLDSKSNLFDDKKALNNFGQIYISSKEYIDHLLSEIAFLKEHIDELVKIMQKRNA